MINPDFEATAREVRLLAARVSALAELDSSGRRPSAALVEEVAAEVSRAVSLDAAREGYTPALVFAGNALRSRDWGKALRLLAKAAERALPGPGGRQDNSRLAKPKPWAPRPQAVSGKGQAGTHLGRGFVED